MLAVAEAGVLHYQLDRPDDARIVLEAALGKVVDDPARRQLHGALAAMGARSPFESTTDPRELAADARAGLAAAIDWTGAGRFQLALTTIDHALATSAERPSDSPVTALLLRSTRTWATLLAGDVLDAETDAEREYSTTVRTTRTTRGHVVPAPWRHRGHAWSGRRSGRRPPRGPRDHGLGRPGPQPADVGLPGHGLALTGDADGGREHERRAEAARSTMDGMFAGEVARAHAWVLAAGGELSAAADQALAAARLRWVRVITPSRCARCTTPPVSSGRRTSWTASRTSPRRSRVATWPPWPATCGRWSTTTGPRWTRRPRRSPSWGSISSRPRRASLRRAPTAGSVGAAVRSPRSNGSRAHEARCPGARTPTLAASDLPDDLTSREREVAELAASELTSRAIAQRLGITTRTVDNLLGRVYTKLGISSRQDLSDLFEGSRSS